MLVVFIFLAAGVGMSVAATFLVVASWLRRRLQPPAHSRRSLECVYCRSANVKRISQEPRRDDEGYALVNGFECLRCGLPFWRVDRMHQHQHSH